MHSHLRLYSSDEKNITMNKEKKGNVLNSNGIDESKINEEISCNNIETKSNQTKKDDNNDISLNFLTKALSKWVVFIKNVITQKIQSFKKTKQESLSEMPKVLQNKILLFFALFITTFILGILCAFFLHDFSFFLCGLLFTLLISCLDLYYYYIFTRKKYIKWVGIPLKKEIKKNIFKRNPQCLVTVCFQDESQRILKVTKMQLEKLSVGAGYIFYFGLDQTDANGIKYNEIFAFEEIKNPNK